VLRGTKLEVQSPSLLRGMIAIEEKKVSIMWGYFKAVSKSGAKGSSQP